MRKIKVIHLGREFDAVLLPGNGPTTVAKPSSPPKATVPKSSVTAKAKVAKRRVPGVMHQGPGYSSDELRAKLRAAILQSRQV